MNDYVAYFHQLITLITDSQLVVWIIVALYLVAILRCFFKSKASKHFGGNYHFWWYLAVFLLVMAVNKQFDLLHRLTEMVMGWVYANEWQDYLPPIQIALLAIFLASFFITLLSLRFFVANVWRNYKIACSGIILLALLAALNLLSIKPIIKFLNAPMIGTNLNNMMEISAILIIIIGTYFKAKYATPLTANTESMKDYVAIRKEGDAAKCPQCGTQPLAKTLDGRTFKCRSCDCKFTVNVVNI